VSEDAAYNGESLLSALEARDVQLANLRNRLAKTAAELNEARGIAETLHKELHALGEKYAGGPVTPLPELPWSQPDLSREALIAAVKGGGE
jgi:hypothetical protein